MCTYVYDNIRMCIYNVYISTYSGKGGGGGGGGGGGKEENNNRRKEVI